MGQEQSQPVQEDGGREVTLEQLSKELALEFAAKCYTNLELYHFKAVFKNAASTESGLRYWREGTLTQFLELPDALGVDHVLYQMATNLGAFPFPSLAPCILTIEAIMKVVTLLTERYARLLKRGKNDRVRVVYYGLAVFDRRASERLEADAAHDKLAETKEVLLEELNRGMKDLEMEVATEDVPPEDHRDEDELGLAALDLLSASEAHRLTARPNLDHSIIPTDNLLKLIELLLLVAPIGAPETVAAHPDRLTPEGLARIRSTAMHILSAFNVLDKPGVAYDGFAAVVPASLPFLFNGLAPLFEHFLFGKDIGLPRRRRNTSFGTLLTSPVIPEEPGDQSPDLAFERSRSPTARAPNSPPHSPASPRRSTSEVFPSFDVAAPLLPLTGEILDVTILCQLSFFMTPSSLFHRMHQLYSGNENGFSLNSFEKEVFSWRGPTLLLVSGTILPDSSTNASASERHFHEHLPPRRFAPSIPANPSSSSAAAAAPRKVVYGAYVPTPWHTTHKAPIGNPTAVLFQLSPTHDVFHASSLSKDYVTFSVPPHAAIPGIGVGNPLPVPSPGEKPVAPLGQVSLFLDEALEYAVFTHTAAVGNAKTSGGSFQPSQAPGRRGQDWQDRFEIDALECWGVGGAEQSRMRSRTLEFEEREARLRREGRGSVVGSAGWEADREILKMAGLIGHGEEGGSMVGEMGGRKGRGA